MIDGKIVVTIVRVENGQVRVGIDAPPDLRVMRRELLDRVDGGEGAR